MNIKPQDKPISELLSASFFEVPRFQRPYSWTTEHVEDFWRDIVDERVEYFIGSCVFYTEKKTPGTLFVVDGQQRLTTITIMLCLIRDKYAAILADDQARGLNPYILRGNVDNKEQVVLSPAASRNWFLQNVQAVSRTSTETSSAEEELLKDARDQIATKIDSQVQDKSTADARKILDRLRDKLLGLRLITIALDNQDDAYIIFETLNTRGEELRLVDMVKNHVMRTWKAKTAPIDEARDLWKKILDKLETLDLDDGKSSSRFIHYAWMSRHEYQTENGLYRRLREQITDSTAKDYLISLADDAESYSKIVDAAGFPWPKAERRLGDALRAIRSFKVAQSIPLLLSLLRARKRKLLKQAELHDVAERIRNFHFQYSAIAQKRTGGGTALMFSSLARDITAATNMTDVRGVIAELTEKLQSRLPLQDEFSAKFVQLRYDHDAARQIVRFALQAIDSARRTNSELGPANYDLFDIEHLASQSGTQHTLGEADRHNVGNLILVPRELNETLGEEAPLKKLATLRKQKTKIPLDEVLLKATVWDADTVKRRAKLLAEEVRLATSI
jgi:Protein of unknown function DUF262/Protein of unknown function (DUF1524)